MLTPPIDVDEILKAIAVPENDDFSALEFNPSFNISDFNPQTGEIFKIWVPINYISYNYPGISEHKVFGSTHYAPQSDIAGMILHSGILYINPKTKLSTYRRFCTVLNLFEVMGLNETEFHKSAVSLDLPIDLKISGVLVHIYIDTSPLTFPSMSRNGFRSTELLESQPFSMRITNFSIITAYDEQPSIVPPGQYLRQKAILPTFKFTFTGNIGIVFSRGIFMQLFSRFNIIHGMFNVYCIFFDVEQDRYEISSIGDTEFTVNKLINPSDTERRKKEVISVISSAFITDFAVGKNKLVIKGTVFQPVDSLLITIPKDNHLKKIK